MFEFSGSVKVLDSAAGTRLQHEPVDFSRILAAVLAEVGESVAPTASEIASWVTALGAGSGSDDSLSETSLVERIGSLERLKAAASASQARYSVLLEKRIRERRFDETPVGGGAGGDAERVGIGPRPVDPAVEAGHAVALARGESPSKGGRLLGLAKALVNEMPHTLNALAAGRINEWRATLVVRETACLDLEDRTRVDEAMVPLYAQGGVGDRQLAGEARKHAQRLDPAAAVKRSRRAMAERRLTLRPAPDSMAILSCLVPAAQGVAAYKALTLAADSSRVAGEGEHERRTRDQIMADTLIERVTGQKRAEDVRIAVNVVMADSALVAGSAEPAVLSGYGALPAQIARDLVLNSLGSGAGTVLRRLYVAPSTGSLTAKDSRSRTFPTGLREFIALRDQTCRNPWCDAPIRHFDHITPAARGGPTSATNGQGLCERCNQAKEAPGWTEGTIPATRHTVAVTTPTGHCYTSTAPLLPGTREIVGHRVEFPGGEYVFHTAA
ncbi:HNH endonuclease [Sinomonas flava]|uniref:HNH endonuclease n=1 Tax=Sinomonas flava TaxID=496857 RepID=UPI0039A50546